MATYMELRFHTVGEAAHGEAVAAVRTIPGVEVLLDHTRELGWLERERLRVPEWDCRIVLGILDHDERLGLGDRLTTELDPYRFLDFGGPKRRVPSRVAELAEQLHASYALIDKGWLRFETRAYEAELLDALRAELTTIAGTYAKLDFASARGILTGRIEGQVPVVRALHRALQRSGLVDFGRVLVGYA